MFKVFVSHFDTAEDFKAGKRKAYCVMIAKIVAVIAIPFAASGITGLVWNASQTVLPAEIVFIAAMAVCICWSRKIVRKSLMSGGEECF